MNSIIQCAISDLIITPCNLYLWVKLTGNRLNFKSLKTYIIIILMYVITLLNYLYNNTFIRILTITIVMAILIKILFKENIKKSILTSVTSQLIYMISELIFALIISIILKLNSNDIVNTQFGSLTANFAIAALAVIISNFPFVLKFYKLLIRITDKIRKYQIIILSLLVILIANILTMILYYKVQFSYLLLFNTLLSLFCFFIVLYSFRTKNNYIKVYDKYNTTLNSLKEYEDILDRYRVSNHENKNQLLTIRNMIPKTNKKAIKYIDTILENKLKDNDSVMFEVAKIPTGGLRGLIYSKVLLMRNLNVEYELVVSNEVRTADLINNIDDSTMLDICKIIGAYLDNSIQAVENIEEKCINIEMYIDNNNLFISISNNYEGVIDIDKIEEKGYTSKGKNHGYGLTLAKKIIENNKKLSNEKSISKGIFSQTLIIKM